MSKTPLNSCSSFVEGTGFVTSIDIWWGVVSSLLVVCSDCWQWFFLWLNRSLRGIIAPHCWHGIFILFMILRANSLGRDFKDALKIFKIHYHVRKLHYNLRLVVSYAYCIILHIIHIWRARSFAAGGRCTVYTRMYSYIMCSTIHVMSY